MRILLDRRRKEDEERRVRELVLSAPIVPCRDGLWRAANEVFWTTDETAVLFDSLGLKLAFASRTSATRPSEVHCLKLDAKSAIDVLSARLQEPLQMPPSAAGALLNWFDEHRSELRQSETLRSRLGALPIFPSANGLRPLTQLSLPGDFEDPLDLAELVDIEALGGRKELLSVLGARNLTIQEYATRHVPIAMARAEQAPDKRRALVQLLAAKLGELRDDPDALSALGCALVVECEDGEFRRPSDVYLPSEAVRAVVGPGVICSAASSQHPGAVRDFLLWIGVAEQPRVEDVLSRLAALSEGPPDESAVARVATILQFLAQLHASSILSDATLASLKTRAWLPAEGDNVRWYKADEIYSSFRDFLFKSQARFLAFARPSQKEAANLFGALHIRSEPTPDQVVSHLLYCSAQRVSTNPEVFSFLALAAGDSRHRAALKRLEGAACIPLSDGVYHKPQQVFWGEQPFGRWRAALGPDFRKYQALFELLGVRESPSAHDALAVLEDLEQEFGNGNRVLDEEAQAVAQQCWRLLTTALESGEMEAARLEALSSRRVVPGPQGNLEQPLLLFFEDRTGFNERFPQLRNNLIPRREGERLALAAAGVTSIGAAATIRLLEAADPKREAALEQRIGERLREIARVLDLAQGSTAGGASLEEITSRLSCLAVDTLVVQYSVDVWGRNVVSEPEAAMAVYRREEHSLYYQSSARSHRWPAIARELALALGVNGEAVGSVASGLSNVLAAETLDDAKQVLDDLGYSRLAEPNSVTPSPNSFETLAGAGELPDRDPYTPSDEVYAGNADSDPLREYSASPVRAGRAPATAKRSEVAAQAKLRSYVSRIDASTETPSDTQQERVERIEATDSAGIAIVMRFEREAGRFPEQMPHENPGYDIKSRDSTGRVVRYIEVKSSAVTWGAQGVALSDVQFKMAGELGGDYWLYVVDRALEEAAQLYRIQNPAQRVGQYFFDDGWRAVSEL